MEESIKLLAERPLQGSDLSQKNFHLENQVNALSRIIKYTATPFTISIQGEWGSGKTSFMNFVLKNFESDKYQAIVINTWDYTQFKEQNIAANILVELVHRIVPKEDEKGVLKVMGSIFSQIAFGKMNAFLREYFLLSKENVDIKETINEVSNDKDYLGNISKTPVEEIKIFRKTLQEYINKDKRKRVIFIDDLDRLHPTDVVEILEALQIFLSLENCIFILAVDYDVIIEGYMHKMSENMSTSTANDNYKAARFFDKIIQLPFNLPTFDDYYAQSFIKDMLEKILNNTQDYAKEHKNRQKETLNINKIKDEDIEIILEYFKHSIGLNPRQMKRVMNTYWLNNLIASDKDISQDLIADIYLTCMKIEYLDLYKLIYKYAAQKDIIESFFELIENQSFKELLTEEVFKNSYFKTDLKILIDKNKNNQGYLLRMQQYLSYVNGLFIDSNGLTDKFISALQMTQMSAEELQNDFQEELIARVVLNLKEKATYNDIEMVTNILNGKDLSKHIDQIHLGINKEESYQILIDLVKPSPKSMQYEIKDELLQDKFYNKINSVTSHKVLYKV